LNRLIVIAVLLVSCGAVLAETPTYISGLSDYEVRVLSGTYAPTNGTSSIQSVTPSEWLTSDPGAGLEGVITAWNGGPKVVGSKLIVHGGGHGDSANNGVYIFDFSGTSAPTGWDDPVDVSTVANVRANQATYADGSPVSSHTYDGLVYASHNDTFYRFGGSRWSDGSMPGRSFKYNVATGQWSQLSSDFPGGDDSGCKTFYDPTTGNLFVTTQDVSQGYFFRTSNDTWSGAKGFSGDGFTYNSVASAGWDSSRGRGVVVSENENSLVTINFSAETVSVSSFSPSGSTAIFSQSGVSAVYDAIEDVYWLFGGGTSSPGWSTIYSMDPDTFVTTAHSLSGDSISVVSGMIGSFGRFAYMEDWRAIGVVASHTSAVYVINLPDSRISDLTCSSTNDFNDAVDALDCGDTLRVRDSATCTNSSRLSIAKACSSGSPVTIMAYPGESPVVTNSAQNTINVEGSQYLTITGLEITSSVGDGITLAHASNANITISDNVIHDIDVSINSPSHNATNLTITGNEIYNTGGTGEGMYMGLHGDCTTGTFNSTITNNYIHDLGGSQGDGIELKCGGYGNTIADNVIEDSHSGYAGILIYGNEGAQAANIVERNLVMNCQGSEGEGILACGDAIIRNNIVLNCNGGGVEIYNVAPAAGTITNVTAVNNTVYNATSGADCLWFDNDDLAASVIVANNALYCPNGNAVYDNGPSGSAVLRDNYVDGSFGGSGSWSIDNSEFYDGGVAADAFINPAVPPTASDFWPKVGSSLIDNGNATYAPADDFNATTRTGTDDVGAYESGACGYNNGWAIDQGFKDDTVACAAGVCGDGTPDPGEECDDGAANGTLASCCAAVTCLFNADTVACTSDSNGCTDDFCSGVSNVCVYTNNTDACDDSLYCNGTDTCSGGSCSAHTGDPCPGPDADTDCSETCDEGADTCTANDTDGSVCGDQTATTCNAANTCLSGTCENNYAADGTTCTDLLYCNGTDQCLTGACATHAGNPCPGADGDVDCSEMCVEATDTCTGPDPNGSVCDADGRACTEPDTCTTGTCNSGPNVCPQFRGANVKGGTVR